MITRKEQLDLFVALVGDIPLRDDREAMSAPMVSLAKRPPARLEWTGPSGQHVEITAGEIGAIATIYDFDIVIWAISQVNAGLERDREVGPKITFRPYDMLRAIGRGTSGRDYERLKAASTACARPGLEPRSGDATRIVLRTSTSWPISRSTRTTKAGLSARNSRSRGGSSMRS